MKDVSKEKTEERKYIKSIPNKSQCERYKSNYVNNYIKCE